MALPSQAEIITFESWNKHLLNGHNAIAGPVSAEWSDRSPCPPRCRLPAAFLQHPLLPGDQGTDAQFSLQVPGNLWSP